MTQTHDFTRRDFLKTASAATLAALAAGYPRALLAATEPKIAPTADAVIVLWMAGGMAHTETFDPKRYAPFTPGMPANAVLSTFPAIPTAVDGIQFSIEWEHLTSPERYCPVLFVGSRIGTPVQAGLAPSAVFDLPGRTEADLNNLTGQTLADPSSQRVKPLAAA